MLRIPPALHARLSQAARERGVSLNEYCRTAVESYTDGPTRRQALDDPGGEWVAIAQQIAGDSLRGVILFGSQARGESSASSDVDLLVVVSDTLELTREVYRRWDGICPDRRLSPHFVHLPDSVSAAGSIWYEVALDGVILYARDQCASAFLQSVRRAIADGRLRRRYAHGHPYWVKDLEVSSA